jgi:hypothetical protein
MKTLRMKSNGNTVYSEWERTMHKINKNTNRGDYERTAKLLKREIRLITHKGTMQQGDTHIKMGAVGRRVLVWNAP